MFNKSVRFCINKGFYKAIRNYLKDLNILKIDLLSSYFVTNIIMINIYGFYLSIVDKILSKSNRSLIVIFKRDERYFFEDIVTTIFFLVLQICFNLSFIYTFFHKFDLNVLIIGQ